MSTTTGAGTLGATAGADGYRLDRLADLLGQHLDALVAAYETHLRRDEDTAALLDRLGADNLRAAHRDQLAALLDPACRTADLRVRGRTTGRALALAGVEADRYAGLFADHQQLLYDALADVAGPDRGVAVLERRSLAHLHGVLQGFRDLAVAESAVLTRVTAAVAAARTVPDLARGVLDALSLLDGMVAVFIGRPREDGGFLFEAGAGDGVEELIAWLQRPGSPVVTASADTPLGHGPVGCAWRSGDVVRCDDYLTDVSTRPWREWGERAGWRASAAVPLTDGRGVPLALLSLFASWPGYFSSPGRTALLEQVRAVVERAYEELADRPHVAAEVQAYVDREAHLDLLRAGSVEMLFQPVVSLPEGRLLRLEALARLVDGTQRVSPADFLPALGDEELFTLFEIGLDQSLAAVAAWGREAVTTGVSVNMPVAAAREERYLHAVADALSRHGVPGHLLTLELLETGAMPGSLEARRSGLGAFRALGVRLAQDDLGSGHSSLLRLRHFDFDTVKIDQSLVRATEDEPQGALQFVRPIGDIAHSLGLHVTLEGLETPGLVEAAAQLGVDSGQGYAIARPMPATDVPTWARQHRLHADPDRPSTALGALAGHVAWEHTVTAFGASPARLRLAGPETCVLTAYLHEHRTDDHARLEALHGAVHAEALTRRGGPAHRSAWRRLAAAIGEG